MAKNNDYLVKAREYLAAMKTMYNLQYKKNGSGKTYTTGYANLRLSCLPCMNAPMTFCLWLIISEKSFPEN